MENNTFIEEKPVKWLYDIILKEGNCKVIVGDQGDELFDTEEEAYADAMEYLTEIAKDSSRQLEDFEIDCYTTDIY